MRRRTCIALLCGAAAALPTTARAQQAERVRRIGMLLGFSDTDPESPLRIETFRQTLERLGWKEGRNVHIDYRWAGADPKRLELHAKDLIRAMPDVVVAESTPAAAAVKQESQTTPIIFINAGNPIGSGLVASFTHPGGNLTGFTNYVPSMGGKWMELLKELAPRLDTHRRPVQPQDPHRAILERARGRRAIPRRDVRQGRGRGCGRNRAGRSRQWPANRAAACLVMPELLQHEPSRDDRRFGRAPPRAGDLRVSRVPRQRRPDLVRDEPGCGVPGRGIVCRPHPARRETGRPAGAGADQTGAGDQPQDREGARPPPCPTSCWWPPTR